MLSFEYSLFFSVMNINKWRCFSSLKTSSSKRVHLHTVLLYRISPVQKRIHLLTGTISIIPQCPFLKKSTLCHLAHIMLCLLCYFRFISRMSYGLFIYLFIYLFAILPNSSQIPPNPCNPTRVKAWPFLRRFLRCTVHWYVVWNGL